VSAISLLSIIERILVVKQGRERKLARALKPVHNEYFKGWSGLPRLLGLFSHAVLLGIPGMPNLIIEQNQTEIQ
jgi:hypothetical protein